MDTIYQDDLRVVPTTRGLSFQYRGETRYVRPAVNFDGRPDGTWITVDADGHVLSVGSRSADEAVRFFLGEPQSAAVAVAS